MRRHVTALGVLFAAGLSIAGCSASDGDGTDAGQNSPGDGRLAIGTTTMLGDVVGDIMECAGGTAETLMPVGADPHDFSASSAQVARLVEADLVVANGLGLEEGLADALEGAEADDARVLEVAPLVDPIEFGGEHGHEDEGEDQSEEETWTARRTPTSGTTRLGWLRRLS